MPGFGEGSGYGEFGELEDAEPAAAPKASAQKRSTGGKNSQINRLARMMPDPAEDELFEQGKYSVVLTTIRKTHAAQYGKWVYLCHLHVLLTHADIPGSLSNFITLSNLLFYDI